MEFAFVLIHVLAAAVWVGGTIALVFAAVPVLAKLDGEQRSAGMRALGRRWRPIGWGALALLLVTGMPLAAETGLDGWKGVVLAVKIGLVAALVVLAYLHDFVLGPRLSAQVRAGLSPTERPRLVLVGRASLALTIVVPVLGVALAHG